MKKRRRLVMLALPLLAQTLLAAEPKARITLIRWPYT